MIWYCYDIDMKWNHMIWCSLVFCVQWSGLNPSSNESWLMAAIFCSRRSPLYTGQWWRMGSQHGVGTSSHQVLTGWLPLHPVLHHRLYWWSAKRYLWRLEDPLLVGEYWVKNFGPFLLLCAKNKPKQKESPLAGHLLGPTSALPWGRRTHQPPSTTTGVQPYKWIDIYSLEGNMFPQEWMVGSRNAILFYAQVTKASKKMKM